MSEPSTTTTLTTSLSNLIWGGVCLLAFALLAAAPGSAEAADDDFRTVAVVEPFLEMHTGPGHGYPIFHTVDRGESIEILMQRTYWYQVRTDRGIVGWVNE
ncbi:MAG: SH3 domain-containing protein, partial [Woeseiaceae bacterium]